MTDFTHRSMLTGTSALAATVRTDMRMMVILSRWAQITSKGEIA
jgi:hypothetical protein